MAERRSDGADLRWAVCLLAPLAHAAPLRAQDGHDHGPGRAEPGEARDLLGGVPRAFLEPHARLLVVKASLLTGDVPAAAAAFAAAERAIEALSTRDVELRRWRDRVGVQLMLHRGGADRGSP